MTRKYETIVVYRPDLGEALIKEEQKRFEALLTAQGAKNITVESLGKKDIAYSVKKQRSGVFVWFRYESEVSDTVKNVTSILRITDSVIKFQTHLIKEKFRKFKGNPMRVGSADIGDDFGDSGDDLYN